jgi:DNA replication protein DnaC
MGVGKTQLLRFLTVLAASKYQRQVALTSTSYLINKVKASFGEVDSNSNAFLNQLAQVDILVLDDLGAEQVTP